MISYGVHAICSLSGACFAKFRHLVGVLVMTTLYDVRCSSPYFALLFFADEKVEQTQTKEDYDSLLEQLQISQEQQDQQQNLIS